MSSLLPQLRGFPPQTPLSSENEYDKHAKAFVGFLANVDPSILAAAASPALLSEIEPSINSISFLHVLLQLAKVDRPEGPIYSISPGSELWAAMLNFVSSFDAVQVRYAGNEFRLLIESIERGCRTDAIMAVEPIARALQRLDPTGATLTSGHLLFVQTCLHARAYSLALPILDKDIFHLPGKLSKAEKEAPHMAPCASHPTSATFITTASGFSHEIGYQTFLRYFLYGAMAYIGVKDWSRALEFLNIVLTVPCQPNCASMIQVEAYKKWVLLNLLQHGKVRKLPSGMSSQVTRSCRVLGKAYEALAEAFKSSDVAKLAAEIQVGPFEKDCNMSLVLLLPAAHHKFTIFALSKAEVHAFVSELIVSGELDATLTGPPSQSILRFGSASPDQLDERKQLEELEAKKQKIREVGAHMKETQKRLEMSREYIEAAKRSRKHDARGIKNGELPFDEETLAEM